MAQSDVRELEKDGSEKSRRRFDARDQDYIAETVIEEYRRRKEDRRDKERCWKEIDRQIAMEPDTAYKYVTENGTRKLDSKKAWMAEVELPLQAQALEVLTADARRMLFPDSGAWFRAHAALTDDYLRKVDFQSLILGDETEVPSLITQDNADKLVEGFLMHLFAESAGDNNEDFFTRYDKIDAEAFKYGVGVGRGVMWNRALYNKVPGGMRREVRKLPVLQPCSIKNLYLDDRKPSMHSMQLLEPAHIAVDHIRLENLHMAANRGSTDPDNEDGGWMPKNLKGIEADYNGYVTLLEMEGDIVIPRKTTRSLVLPGVIVTVVLGGRGSGTGPTRGLIRLRWRQTPGSSYFLHPYHYEGADDVYPASPLMKGRPVQIMCTDALNRLLDSAMLKNAPPVGWDRSDSFFAQNGGPAIHPYGSWGTVDPGAIKVFAEVGGDPSALAAVLTRGISLYAELTGVLPARLGAQTTSHTTAFAKDAELQRGAVRTVDYVRQIGKGPMTRWLDMAYRMGRGAIGNREPATFFIDAYGGWVEVTRDQLPERATFEWFGSGGPADDQQKKQMRLQALQFALQMDQLGAALGKQPAIQLDNAIAQVLREGGWTDVDAVLGTAQPATPVALPPPSGVVSADPALIAAE